MAMDHAVKAAPAKESALGRLCRPRRFESKALETIYQKYSLASQRRTLIKVLWVFATAFLSLAALNVYFVRAPNIYGICYGALCAVFVVLLASAIQIKRKIVLQRLIVYATLQFLLVFVVLSLPINYTIRLGTRSADPSARMAIADGAWTVVVTVFAVYTTLPVSSMLALAFGVATSLAQLIVAATLVDLYEDGVGQQLAANLLLFVWTNVVGLYLHSVWNQILRTAFLDTRNCVAARQDIEDENEKLERLLSSALPQHVATAMKCDISQCADQKLRNTYIQQYENVSVIFADIGGFQSIVTQCTAQDTVRIVNQIFARFDQLAKQNECLRIRILGDAYLAVCGVPDSRPDHAACCVKLGADMIETIRSIVEQTGAEIAMRVGIDSGTAVCGVVGLKKWHYDVWSDAVENAYWLQSTAQPDKIHISQATLVALEDEIDCQPANNTDKFGRASYYVVTPPAKRKTDPLLFHDGSIGSKAGHRLSYGSVSLCINRLLQSVNVTANGTSDSFGSTLPCNGQAAKGQQLWRKRYLSQCIVMHSKVFSRGGPIEQGSGNRVNLFLSQAIKGGCVDQEKSPLLDQFTLRFKNALIERGFNQQLDRWFVPAVAGCIPFLIIYAVYHSLVLPHQISALLLIVAALAVMCAILSVLYIDYFKGFRLFITRTFWGHSLAILLIVALLCTCGVVNTYSCPVPKVLVESETSSYGEGEFVACAIPQYALLSCLLWLLTVAIFIRFSALMTLVVMLMAGAVYGIHVFHSHSALYYNYSLLVHAAVASEHELILAIIALMALIFIQARRNEWAIRIDFLWKLQAIDERSEMRELQSYNQRILFNLLPPHVAFNFLSKSDPYYHGSHRVGVAFMNVDLKGRNGIVPEKTMRILHEIVCRFDTLLDDEKFRAIDKIKTVNSSYMVAVGLLPDFHCNTNSDNIKNLLLPLADFALAAKARLAEFNAERDTMFKLNVGIDCGYVIAGVIGSDKPQYDIWGAAVNQAKQLQLTAAAGAIQVSEDVFLALRSSNAYQFDVRRSVQTCGDRSITAYCLVDHRKSKEASPTISDHNSHNSLSVNNRSSPLRVYQGGIALPGLSDIIAAKNRLTAAILNAEPMSEDPDDKEPFPFLGSPATRPPARTFSSSFALVANKRPSIPTVMQQSMAESDISNIEIEMVDGTTDGEQHYIDVEEHERIGRLQQLLAHAMRPSEDNETDALVMEMAGSIHSSYSSDLFSTDAYKAVPLESEEDLEWITPQIISRHSTLDRTSIFADISIPYQLEKNQQMEQSDLSDVGGPAMPLPSSVCSPLIKQQKQRKPKRRQRRNTEENSLKRMSATSQSDLEPTAGGYRPSPRLLSWLRYRKANKGRRSPLPLGVSEISDGLPSDSDAEKGICSPSEVEKRKMAASDELEAAASRVDKMLLELSSVHAELPESDQAHYMSEQTNTGPRDSPLCRPFPTDAPTPYFMQSEVMSAVNGEHKPCNKRNSRQPTSAAQTEYENADSDYPCSETESQLRGCSPDNHIMNGARLFGYNGTSVYKNHAKDDSAIGSTRPFTKRRTPCSSLDYLGLDPGHEADIDSVCSSRASSRVFFDESLRFPFPQSGRGIPMTTSRKSIGYDSEYDNFRNGLSQDGVFRVPSQISDMEIDFFDADEGDPIDPLDEMRKLARDIKQNFGEFNLASFSDVEK